MDLGTGVLQLEWMLMPLFCTCTGYSTKAIERKIEDGKWIEGRMYRRAPDGRITINLQEYYRWVNGSGASTSVQERRMRAGERRRAFSGS